MCLCTHYDSPTCGHSWTSMTESCGYGHDLLNCPRRETMGYLVAPAYTCPQCNGGFADGETLQMVQGPWGCNQLLRNQMGGDYALGNAWAGSRTIPQLWSGRSMPYDGLYGADTRLSGPYGGPAITCGPPAITCGSPMPQAVVNQRLICDEYYDDCRDCCDGGRRGRYYDYDYGYSGRRRQRRHDYQYKYRRSTRDGQGCNVM